jgi:O-antigen ligase
MSLNEGVINKSSYRVLVVVTAIVCLFFLARPGMVTLLGPTNSFVIFMDAARLVFSVLCCVLYFVVKRIDVFGFLVVLAGAAAFCSLYFNDVSLYSFWTWWLPCCALALATYAVSNKFRNEMLWAFLIWFTVLSIINFVLVLMYPYGLPIVKAGYYFCGHKNSAILSILPSMGASLLLDGVNKKKPSVRSVLIWFLSFAQVLLLKSSTSCAVLVFMAVMVMVLCFKKSRPFLNLYTYLGGYAAFFVAFVLLRIQAIFAPIIEGIFNKSISFTGRTEVWDEAIRRVVDTNILIGCGNTDFKYAGTVVYTAHNSLLNIFCQGGLVGLLGYVGMWVYAAMALWQTHKEYYSAMLALILGCYLVEGLMESTIWPGLFIFLGLAAAMRKSCDISYIA